MKKLFSCYYLTLINSGLAPILLAAAIFAGGHQTAIAQMTGMVDLETPSSLAASSEDAEPDAAMLQVTSVSQLTDVQPTDWAFQALQSLVERYGCVVGYPDSTYRGNRAMTRYEFAAGLNACMDRVNELIATATADLVTKEDLKTLQRLQEEFAAELAALRGRVDALEARTATLEAQQFSTTTKLFGQAIFGLQTRGANTADLNPRNGIKDTPDPATNTTFGYNVELSLLTAFSDRSFLLTGLQMGNLYTGAGFSNPPYFLNDTYTRLGYETNTNNNIFISDLNYRFLVGDRLSVIVGPAGVNPITVFRGPNRYENAGQGPISAFAQRDPILGTSASEAGVGFDWQVADKFSVQAVYSAGSFLNPASEPFETAGLFNGPYTLGVQLATNVIPTVDWSIYYLNSYSTNARIGTGIGDDLIGFVGSRNTTNSIGTTISWRAAKGITVGGWFGYTNSNVQGTSLGLPAGGYVETINWMAFLNFPDLFGYGNLGGIYVGQPPKITSSTIAVNGVPSLNIPSTISGTGGVAGGQPASTLHVEAFYRWRVADNISVTPGVLVLFNPVHTASSDTIITGVLRTTFTF